MSQRKAFPLNRLITVLAAGVKAIATAWIAGLCSDYPYYSV